MQTSKAEPRTELELELMEISRVVRLSLDRLKGPLKHVLRETLHNPDRLPDASCYSLAAEAIDALHEAQQSIEPRTLILADHFLGSLPQGGYRHPEHGLWICERYSLTTNRLYEFQMLECGRRKRHRRYLSSGPSYAQAGQRSQQNAPRSTAPDTSGALQ